MELWGCIEVSSPSAAAANTHRLVIELAKIRSDFQVENMGMSFCPARISRKKVEAWEKFTWPLAWINHRNRSLTEGSCNLEIELEKFKVKRWAVEEEQLLHWVDRRGSSAQLNVNQIKDKYDSNSY